MITTITLNPAVDKTLTTHKFIPGELNIVSHSREDVGGKGLNVSKMLKNFGMDSRATGFIAGTRGMKIVYDLEKNGIQNYFVEIDGETRTNVKIVDETSKLITELNEIGPTPSEEDIKNLIEILKKSPNSIHIISGSIPKGVSPKIYFELVSLLKSQSKFVILDSSGPAFDEGIKGLPNIIKPNLYELQRHFDVEIDTNDDEEIIFYGRKLIQKGIELVVISNREKGSYFIDKNFALKVEGLNVEVQSTVGAGDAMVAAIAFAKANGYEIDQMAVLAAATGAATVTLDGTQFPSYEKVKEYLGKIKYTRF
ncbi:MAG: 1-phosphofructokinase [Fusobacteria bacterium]|nr:1-phosphofructokinase [Fusobacteriota bacterium]